MSKYTDLLYALEGGDKKRKARSETALSSSDDEGDVVDLTKGAYKKPENYKFSHMEQVLIVDAHGQPLAFGVVKDGEPHGLDDFLQSDDVHAELGTDVDASVSMHMSVTRCISNRQFILSHAMYLCAHDQKNHLYPCIYFYNANDEAAGRTRIPFDHIVVATFLGDSSGAIECYDVVRNAFTLPKYGVPGLAINQLVKFSEEQAKNERKGPAGNKTISGLCVWEG